MKSFKLWGAVSLILVLSAVLLSATAFAADGDDITNPAVMVSEPSTPVLSVAVRDLERTIPDRVLNREEINPLRNPGLFTNDFGLTGTFTHKQDPLAANSVNSKLTPAKLFDFEGLGTDGYSPPDTVGDVGPNHYIQMVNVSFAIFNKSGINVVPDTPFTNLFSGSGLTACENENDGDPIVVYDEIADRWLLSQFAVTSGTRMCIAISQTSDPSGAYYLYQFDMPDFPDYFKFGVWPDAYYMGTNTGYPNQYYAYAFDRASMLSGSPATYQYSNAHPNFLMPADLDGGLTNPPPAGSPGYFYTMLSDGYPDHPVGVDRLAVYEFNVDWATPPNSTFGLATEIPIAVYNYTVCGFFVGDCIPQPGTTQRLDSLSYWPMWRLAYRNLGSYEAMVGNFTVDLDGTDKAAIRWFELQKTSASWTMNQEGTYAPDGDHRWMGSIAMDGSGNIALGYSVSSSSTLPAIRYTVHEVSDPLGTMQAEQQIIQSAGVHTSISRWGDYSSLNVDPVDNCTFWYTNQYDIADNTGFDWHTRVGVFKIPSCTGSIGKLGTLTGQVTDASNSNAISGALVTAVGITSTAQTTTDVLGYYTRTLSVGSFNVTAEAYGFQSSTVSNVEILSGTTTTLDISLAPAGLHTVDGTVTDLNTGWPLYAHLSISGDPVDPPVTDLWTDPVTGYYQIDLAEGITYTFDVEAWVPGYLPASADVGPLTGDITADFSLDVDQVACNAPGYAFTSANAEVSTNGGAFQPMWSHTGPTTQAPWQGFNSDISAASGGTAQFRFRFTSDSTVVYNGYYIDNVRVTSSCDPLSGALVVGNVYDDNTLQALNGAMVENEDGYMADALATPLDTSVDDGFYSIFSPSGSKTFTATISGGYGPAVDLVNVTTGDTIGHEFYLPAPSVSVDPAGLEVTLAEGYSTTVSLDLINAGALASDFELVEMPGSTAVQVLKPSWAQSVELISDPSRLKLSLGSPSVSNKPLADIIQDGSFEAGPVGGYWNEYSLNFGTPLCSVGTCGTGTGTGPRTGLYWAWFGGIAAYEEGSVDQDVLIPVGVANLTFWLEQIACDSPADYMQVLIDDVEVFVTNGTSPLCGVLGYSQILVDVSAYADGAIHNVKFYSEIFANNGNVSNFFVDDVVLDSQPFTDVPWLWTDPITGTLAADSMQIIDVTFDAMTYTVGTYTATLMVNTDNPVQDKIELPVTMHVEALRYGIELAADNDRLNGEPSSVVTYTVWITNTGNVIDGYDIAAGSHIWDLDMPASVAPMAPAESQPVEVTITIPADAGDGDSDTVTITVSSQGDPTETAIITLTTEAVIPEYLIYLPLVYK